MDATMTGSRAEGNWKKWAGWGTSGLVILGLAASAAMKLSHAPQLVQNLGHLGYSESAMTGIGLLELAVVALYAIPRTRFLGAVLVTGYLGGAVATHVRVGEAFVPPLVLGILAWVGLYLRDEKARALSPLRS